MDDKPPSGTCDNTEEPLGSSIIDIGDNRSAAPLVLWNLRGAGSGVSRGSLISYLCDNLHDRCVDSINANH